ncbi:S41 family peptidase [soil metagenome]
MTPLIAFALLTQAPADFAPVWDKVASSIRTRYYARDTRKDEMEGLLKKYEPIAKAATDRRGFEDTVNRMIADFHDSHFDYLTDADQGYYLMDGLTHGDKAAEMPQVGAWFRRASDGYTVQMVLDGGEAAKAGLRPGDLVTQVDGEPFTPIDSLKSRAGKMAILTYRRGDREKTVSVNVMNTKAMAMFLNASRASSHVIERDGKKLGYFHLWTQASDDFRSALSAAVYGKLRDTDGFILDLRAGFGGRPEGFADPFFRPEATMEWKQTAGAKPRTEIFGYGRPLVVLIDRGSRSAKEILSFILKTSHRATLVGETTAGNVLGTFPLRISDWSYIEIPVVDVSVDHERLEGKGVASNVAVTPGFNPEGHDQILERGIEVLKEKIATRRPRPITSA